MAVDGIHRSQAKILITSNPLAPKHPSIWVWAIPVFALVSLAVAGSGIIPQAKAVVGKSQGAASSHAGHQVRQPTAVSNGLVAWYPFDGNATDASGNTNNGTLNNFSFNNTTNGWMNGKFGRSLTFDGINNFVNVPDNPSLNFGSGSFTLSVWFNPKQGTSQLEDLLFKGAPGYGSGYSLSMAGSPNPRIGFSFSGPSTAINTNLYIVSGVSTGVWHHLVAVVDRSSKLVTMYQDNVVQVLGKSSGTCGTLVNGNTAMDISACTSTVTSTLPLVIGQEYSASYYQGGLDDLRIYNRSISAAEVGLLYQGSQPVNCDQTCTSWWKLDEASGTSTKDSSGSANAGTLKNFTFNGTTNGWTSGVFGNGLQFDGATNYITSASLVSSAPNVFSLSAWIRTASPTGVVVGFGANQDPSSGGPGDRVVYVNASGNIVFGVFNGTIQVIASPLSYADNNWHHVTATLSPSGAFLFVDGSQVASNASYTTSSAYSGYWSIGNWANNPWPGLGDHHFSGLMDDVRIYSRALSGYEVYDQYSAGR